MNEPALLDPVHERRIDDACDDYFSLSIAPSMNVKFAFSLTIVGGCAE